MTDKSEIIELYKIVVDTISANEQRRQNVTAIYLTIVAAGIAMLGGVKDINPIYIALPTIMISVIWYASIRYFRRLAKAKFIVIKEMEKNFAIRPFELEWQHIRSHEPNPLKLPKWLRIRVGLTHLEMFIPASLAIASIAYLIWRTFYWLIG